MNKKMLNFFIFIFSFFSINYLLYVLLNSNYINTIVKNEAILFFIQLIFISLLFFLIFLIIRERRIRLRLFNSLKEKDNQVKYLTKFIENDLKEQIILCKKNEKKFYEKLRIHSLNEFVSNIAHHWRQSLTVISLAATSLEFYTDDNSINKENILKNMCLINNNVQGLSKTLDKFDNLKISSNQKEVFTIEDILNAIKYLINCYNINIEYKIKKNISIYGNKSELIEVFYSILKNSYDIFELRSMADRKVYIDIQYSAKSLKIKIKDTAGGIENNIKNRIFEPYFSTKHPSYEVGLSLYIVYTIITKRMKGKIEVENVTFEDEENNKLYKGAQFSIEVPRV